jgi:hypothetical protein
MLTDKQSFSDIDFMCNSKNTKTNWKHIFYNLVFLNGDNKLFFIRFVQLNVGSLRKRLDLRIF